MGYGALFFIPRLLTVPKTPYRPERQSAPLDLAHNPSPVQAHPSGHVRTSRRAGIWPESPRTRQWAAREIEKMDARDGQAGEGREMR